MTVLAPTIYSLGQICGMLQTMPRPFLAAAKALDIAPAITINDVPHYSGDDVERIREHLASRKACNP